MLFLNKFQASTYCIFVSLSSECSMMYGVCLALEALCVPSALQSEKLKQDPSTPSKQNTGNLFKNLERQRSLIYFVMNSLGVARDGKLPGIYFFGEHSWVGGTLFLNIFY